MRSRGKARLEGEAERISHDLFREAARKQRCCVMCGRGRSDWHPHHVVYKQHLRTQGKPLYDARNSMRLCINCHAAHHDRSKVVPLSKLTDEHLAYAFEVLGAAAHYYLSQRYEVGFEGEARLDGWLAKIEEEEDGRRTSDATSSATV
jgi:hypothetical protein